MSNCLSCSRIIQRKISHIYNSELDQHSAKYPGNMTTQIWLTWAGAAENAFWLFVLSVLISSPVSKSEMLNLSSTPPLLPFFPLDWSWASTAAFRFGETSGLKILMKSFSTLLPRLFSPEGGRELWVLGLPADTLFFALLILLFVPAEKEHQLQ